MQLNGAATAIIALFASLIALALWFENIKTRRAAYIRTFKLPPGLLDKLARRYPTLKRRDLDLVDRGLRQFFLAHLLSGRKFVAMPSQVADDLWHEFMLYSRAYKDFCDKAFGRFLHHTPAVVLSPGNRNSNAGLRRVWYWACKEDGIDPRNASRLPLLFALDAKLAIPGGFKYRADCSRADSPADGGAGPYCGGDFSSSSVDGSTDGFGDGDSGPGGADGGSDGGGDGGGGCGGGD